MNHTRRDLLPFYFYCPQDIPHLRIVFLFKQFTLQNKQYEKRKHKRYAKQYGAKREKVSQVVNLNDSQ